MRPPNGEPFIDRAQHQLGMIHRRGIALRAFAAIGWEWGGDWTHSKDYQHFSKNGH